MDLNAQQKKSLFTNYFVTLHPSILMSVSVSRPKVLLVGGGLTSAAIASLLAERKANVSVTVWDKAGRTGGRMTTHRRGGGGAGQVDLGAQYITATSSYQATHARYYRELIKAGVLRPLVNPTKSQLVDRVTRTEIGKMMEVGGRKKTGISVSLDDKFWEDPQESDQPVYLVRSSNYVTPAGVESIVDYFWRKSGCLVDTFHPLQKLDLVDRQWVAKTGRKVEQFDCVVTTMPIPQLLGEFPAPEGVMKGNFLDIIKKDEMLYNNLRSIKFNSIFCLGLFYDSPLKENLGLNYKFKYFPQDPVIRFISMDNLKRGDSQSPTCISVQSQVSYAKQNLHKTKQEMTGPLLTHLHSILPNLPPPSSITPHKWRYSQTSIPYPGEPGCVFLHSDPPLVAAGDSFTHSNMDGCLASADTTVDSICAALRL